MPSSTLSGTHSFDSVLPNWLTPYLEHSVLKEICEDFGSPFNLNDTSTFKENIAELRSYSESLELEIKPFFARKANKCLGYIQAAKDEGIGVDVASFAELEQVLNAKIPGRDIVCSAAIKNMELIELSVRNHVTIAADNLNELREIASIANRLRKTVEICPRIAGFTFQSKTNSSRFGFSISTLPELARELKSNKLFDKINCVGLHFHLTGYAAKDRHMALAELVDTVESCEALKETIRFIDIGGGFPVQYVQQPEGWRAFWSAQHESLRSQAEQSDPQYITDKAESPTSLFNSRGATALIKQSDVYPVCQKPADLQWFQTLVGVGTSNDLRARLKKLEVILHCEPGRWLLKNCGATIARVAVVKRDTYGRQCVFVEMNHTQCRTGSKEFFVDPLLISDTELTEVEPSANDFSLANGKQSAEAHIYGAYCTENDLIFARSFQFKSEPRVGQFLVILNTAGYFMHFHESRSHQLPLAANLLVQPKGMLQQDPIDQIYGDDRYTARSYNYLKSESGCLKSA